MRRAASVAALALAIAFSGPSSGAAGGEETAIGVRASEWQLLFTSPPPFDAGPAEIEYVNQGEDPHDLKVRRKGTHRVRSITELEPAGVGYLDLRLRSGARYVMWCSTLSGLHRENGMEATMRVKKG